MNDTAAYRSAVNGWRQALGMVSAQQRALEWCMEKLEALAKSGAIERNEDMAREWLEVVRQAETATEYLAAMEKAGALVRHRKN